jgi:uncharacterized membrane protein (DUF4010 family)
LRWPPLWPMNAQAAMPQEPMPVIPGLDHLSRIALALAIGLLVGLQRGWTLRNEVAGSRFAGIRTFGLLGMAGGVAGVLHAEAKGPATVLLAAVAGLVLVGYQRAAKSGQSLSGTASITGLLTLACGFLASSGEPLLGTAVGVVMVVLLAMRNRLHGWIGRLSEGEVAAIARFALISMVILPLLPDRYYGPYDAWNPRQLWLVVVLVSGLSFAGYSATRMLGATRGTIATAAAGSAVSSTAVTAALATRMRDEDGDPALLAAGIAVASVVMVLRVLVLTGLIAGFAFAELALLAAPAALVSLVAAGWFLRHSAPAPAGEIPVPSLRNPFDLGPALLLAGLVMVMTLVAHWVLERFGDAGLATVLAISGSVDVDSAIITMGTLPAGTLSPRVAGLVLALPMALNSLLKAGVTLSVAGWRKGRSGALPLLATAAAIVLAGAVL